MKLLLDRGDVDPNRPDVNNRTPLGCAAFEGHEGVLKLLLDRKDFNLDRPDINDRTPLEWAAVRGHKRVKLLLKRGNVDLNHPDKSG